MEKFTKIVCALKALVIVYLISTLFSGCFYRYYFDKRPCDQPGSSWASEDGTITFSVDESGAGYGSMVISGESIPIHIGIGPACQIGIYYDETNEYGAYWNIIEEWNGDFFYDDHF